MFPQMEAGLMKLMLLTWKLEWWKYFADMEAGVTKRMFPEIEAWLMKLMLLTWKLEWWKYVAEMEAGVTKRLFPEMEVGLMKLMLLSWKLESWKYVVELKWKRDWRKECCWIGSGKCYEIKILFCDELSATNCPRRIVRDELSGNHFFIWFAWCC